MTDTLFDLPAPEPRDLSGDDLRTEIHVWLRTHPEKTARAIATALNLPDPSGTGARKAGAMLKVMFDEGEADKVPGNPAGNGAVRWVAT